MQPVYITGLTAVTACGSGLQAHVHALREQRCCLQPPRLIATDFPTYTGEVETPLPQIHGRLQAYGSRNARMALAALDCEDAAFRQATAAAVARYGARRVGVIIGTSTSGIYETELAYRTAAETGQMPPSFDFAHQHAWVATADFIKRELGLDGMCYAISTACSSSGKAIAAGQRMIEAGICDAVVVGGIDSLCHMTLYGFRSLELASEMPCQPLDRERDGISIGEGAALLLLERARGAAADPLLLGYGESSDAHHMTAPHPEGLGAAQAMRSALQMAGLLPDDIGYVNLHATGTRLNDQSEMRAMADIFGPATACSGTKGIMGHALGAAGAVEAVIALLALHHGFAPGTCGIRHVDDDFADNSVLTHTQQAPNLAYVMSNNFGFGGNNVSLIFGRKAVRA